MKYYKGCERCDRVWRDGICYDELWQGGLQLIQWINPLPIVRVNLILTSRGVVR